LNFNFLLPDLTELPLFWELASIELGALLGIYPSKYYNNLSEYSGRSTVILLENKIKILKIKKKKC
jgi:hypothetical protein